MKNNSPASLKAQDVLYKLAEVFDELQALSGATAGAFEDKLVDEIEQHLGQAQEVLFKLANVHSDPGSSPKFGRKI